MLSHSGTLYQVKKLSVGKSPGHDLITDKILKNSQKKASFFRRTTESPRTIMFSLVMETYNNYFNS